MCSVNWPIRLPAIYWQRHFSLSSTEIFCFSWNCCNCHYGQWPTELAAWIIIASTEKPAPLGKNYHKLEFLWDEGSGRCIDVELSGKENDWCLTEKFIWWLWLCFDSDGWSALMYILSVWTEQSFQDVQRCLITCLSDINFKSPLHTQPCDRNGCCNVLLFAEELWNSLIW